ncbi:hypothetical protein ALO_05760 [Acetonema longum DSM 6540]|uniref:Uncharacterized protein n=1 Tax=Acetonema longum DSM 6540 TaxID=1009370 RepID=F7NGG4_9FIRM|nr:hypothetical protein ALO_05760 [Acetonema longum DSM 6540]
MEVPAGGSGLCDCMQQKMKPIPDTLSTEGRFAYIFSDRFSVEG